MTVETISCHLHESMGPGRDLQSDSYLLPDTLPIALRGPVLYFVMIDLHRLV